MAPGAKLRGPIMHEGYEHLIFQATVVVLEPETRFSLSMAPVW
jgi:hypothetical protein